jgi:hypothetical protein
MATVRHVTAWAGRTKYQAAWFLLNRVYHPVIDLEILKKTTQNSQDSGVLVGIRSGYIPNTSQMYILFDPSCSATVFEKPAGPQVVEKNSCRLGTMIFVIVFTRYKTIPSQLSELVIVTHYVFIQVDIIYLRPGLTGRLFLQVFRLKFVCVCVWIVSLQKTTLTVFRFLFTVLSCS